MAEESNANVIPLEQNGQVKSPEPDEKVSHPDEVEIEIDHDDLEYEENCFNRTMTRIQDGVESFWRRYRRVILTGVKVIMFLLYLAYFAYCMYYRFGDEGSIRLLGGTAFGVLILVNGLTPGCGSLHCLTRFSRFWGGSKTALIVRKWLRRSLYVAFTVGAAVYIGLEVAQSNPESLQSLAGVFGFVLLTFLISTNPSRVNWHPVFWGISVQFILGVIILRTSAGYDAFDWLGHRIEEFLNYGNAGAEFVFGKTYDDHRIAFSVMSVMLFFNSVIFLLYHLGVIQVIIKTLGTFLAFCMDTGPIESVVASANVFI